MSEDELKFAAFSSALVSVLASVACENAALRSILKDRGLLSDEQWMHYLKQFAAAKWKSFESGLQTKVQEESKHALARMRGGKPH